MARGLGIFDPQKMADWTSRGVSSSPKRFSSAVHGWDLGDPGPSQPSTLPRTLSRARKMTVATVIAGQVRHIRTTAEQPHLVFLLSGRPDPIEQPHHELARLGEPLAKKAVRVDLDQVALGEPRPHSDRQVLRQSPAERGLRGETRGENIPITSTSGMAYVYHR